VQFIVFYYLYVKVHFGNFSLFDEKLMQFIVFYHPYVKVHFGNFSLFDEKLTLFCYVDS